MDPNFGSAIQLAGVLMITLLTLFLRRPIGALALKHWTKAWLFLSFALFCLFLAFRYNEYSSRIFSFYFLAEYIFGFLLVTGCRNLSGFVETTVKQKLFVLTFALVAFGLPFIGEDSNLIFAVHKLIVSGFYAAAFLGLRQARLRTFGWRVMLVALGLLAVDFLHYFAVFAARQYLVIPTGFLAYRSLIDLIFQTLLGFGMVIILLEKDLTDTRKVNEKLKNGHKKLEELAHVDPLTTALNRHAFHGYLKRRGDENQPVSGCVGFFDIDDLKKINDNYGHEVGDSVIRAVVRAIREIIRAEDLIFRWGGDEFCVIMIGFEAKPADERMAKMENLLSNVLIKGVDRPIDIGVSHGFENFADLNDLEATIKLADAGMYRSKEARKEQIDANRVAFRDSAFNSDIHAGMQ